MPVAGWTYLFEIIYPSNRIVLDYGRTDDLMLLGAVQISTGTAVGPRDPICAPWPGPRIEVQAYLTLAEALAEVAAVVAAVAGLERKEIAARIVDNPYRGMIFGVLDGRSILVQGWAAIRPAADRAFGARGEDVA